MTMPSGEYYVGDLCYVLGDKWDEVCDLMFPSRGVEKEGEFTLKDGTKIAVYGTMYGDGEYYDQSGNSYAVDSGSIGCIKVADITDVEARSDFGNTVTFENGFQTFSDSGTLVFGHIQIKTHEEYVDEEDYY